MLGGEINPPAKLRLPMCVKTIEPMRQVSASGPSCRSHGNNFGFPASVIDLGPVARDFSFPRNTIEPTNKPGFLSPFSPAARSVKSSAAGRSCSALDCTLAEGFMHACVAHSPRGGSQLACQLQKRGCRKCSRSLTKHTLTRCRQTETSLEIFANYFQLN